MIAMQRCTLCGYRKYRGYTTVSQTTTNCSTVGRRSEYQPKGGDALRLVSKGRYGNVCGWQVKLCDPLVTHGPYLSALEVQHDQALYIFTLLYFTYPGLKETVCLVRKLVYVKDHSGLLFMVCGIEVTGNYSSTSDHRGRTTRQ